MKNQVNRNKLYILSLSMVANMVAAAYTTAQILGWVYAKYPPETYLLVLAWIVALIMSALAITTCCVAPADNAWVKCGRRVIRLRENAGKSD